MKLNYTYHFIYEYGQTDDEPNKEFIVVSDMLVPGLNLDNFKISDMGYKKARIYFKEEMYFIDDDKDELLQDGNWTKHLICHKVSSLFADNEQPIVTEEIINLAKQIVKEKNQ